MHALGPLKYVEARYGDHALQRVGVWERTDAGAPDGYWVVYVHGGAWRDPRKLLQGFEPAVQSLTPSDAGSTLNPAIAGLASIDYRLSPHPEFPQDPKSVPATEYRDARHPDHILDVRAALALLQRTHGFGDRYILLGHSAGGTLAYQLFMGAAALGSEAPREDVVLPRAVVGIAGIYELVKLDERHDGNYAGFISGAFGPKREWNGSMPALFQGSYKDALGASRAVLAWSPEDSLVDEPEIDGMAERLLRDGVQADVIKTLDGDHDFIWEDGKQLAGLVEQTLAFL